MAIYKFRIFSITIIIIIIMNNGVFVSCAARFWQVGAAWTVVEPTERSS